MRAFLRNLFFPPKPSVLVARLSFPIDTKRAADADVVVDFLHQVNNEHSLAILTDHTNFWSATRANRCENFPTPVLMFEVSAGLFKGPAAASFVEKVSLLSRLLVDRFGAHDVPGAQLVIEQAGLVTTFRNKMYSAGGYKMQVTTQDATTGKVTEVQHPRLYVDRLKAAA